MSVEQEKACSKITDWSRFPIVGPPLRELDLLIGQEGLPGAMRIFLAERNIEVQSLCEDPGTEQALSSGRVLLVAKHPNVVEGGPEIAALSETKTNVFVHGTERLCGVGQNTCKHIIPVYGIPPRDVVAKVGTWLGSVGLVPTVEIPAEPEGENGMGITQARERLEGGNIVVFFPERRNGKRKGWHRGIGKLVCSLNPECPVQIIFGHVTGMNKRDKYRLLQPLSQRMEKKTVLVRFSNPFPLSTFAHLAEEIVVDQLRILHDQFVHS